MPVKLLPKPMIVTLNKKGDSMKEKQIWAECHKQAKQELGTREGGMLTYDLFAVNQRAKEIMKEKTGQNIATFVDTL